MFGPELVKDVADSIVRVADEGKLAVNGEQAREMFSAVIDSQDQRDGERSEELKRFDTEWDYYYSNFFTLEDRPVLESLYSIESLGKLVANIRTDIASKPANRGLAQIDSLLIDT